MSHAVTAEMTREDVLQELLAVERETHELLERAARVATDPEERALFERLAKREECSVIELQTEMDRLDAVEFVQRALDC
jgi:bacterioferritin (cytochrome b1)